MNKYKVLEKIRIRVGENVKEFEPNKIIKLPEQSARLLIEKGKIRLVDEPAQKPITRHYEPTERDRELERYIGRPSMNPSSYKCIRCGAIGERYWLGQDIKDKWWWGWQCLRCSPYHEPERN